MPALRGPWRRIPLQLALFTGAAVSILTGASFNVQGHGGDTGLIAIVAGLLACAAGVFHRQWRAALGFAAGSLVLTLGAAHFVGMQTLGINFTGLVAVALGGVVGSAAYTNITKEMRGRVRDLERLNAELEEKHRIFLAATEDPAVQDADISVIAANVARQTAAGFCCFFLASPDGREFVPQAPAVGFEKARPQPLSRRRTNDLLQAIEAGREFTGEGLQALRSVVPYVPPDFKAANFIAIPLKAGDHVLGFLLLGNRSKGFSEDDRRLARTLALRAAIRLASANEVAQGNDEATRYVVLNQMMKQASLLPFQEAMSYLLDTTADLVAFDAARTAVFQPDGTYMIAGSPMSYSLTGSPLEQVRDEGRSVKRPPATRADGLYSGAETAGEGATACEVLVPIRGKQAVLGALCFGRVAPEGFDDREIPILEEVGAIAGVAAENARALQQVAHDEAQKDRRLDDLREVFGALSVSSQGPRALEQRLLETACRLLDCRFGLISQRAGANAQRVTASVGFPQAVAGVSINAGQGVIGAVIRSQAPLACADVNDGFELASPPDLAAFRLHGALCVPMRSGDQLLGTLSVFAETRREWSESDTRLLEAIATDSVSALKNAEMYDSARRRIWELSKGVDERQRAIVPVLHRLAAAIDARDPRSAGHSERVMEYALVIARELDYAHGDEAAWQRLRDGCLMLDIGKIAIPDAVLSKREQLTAADINIIRTHPVYGYDLLNSLQLFTDELVVVRSHHERYDGGGYPDGTKGDDLPLLAYIAGAADAIDAMVSERPHRRSLSIEVALAEIEQGAGKQFHPDVATALLDSAVRGTLKVIRHRVALAAEAS